MAHNFFTCLNCGTKQYLRHLLFMSNASTWHCHKCNILLKPEKMSLASTYIGFFAVVIPTYYCMFILKYRIGIVMAIGLLFGILAYLLSLVYYYVRIRLEEVH